MTKPQNPTTPDVSVVIPSYNASEPLRETFDALRRQRAKCRIEVIVVDCSDDDRVQEFVQAEQPAFAECNIELSLRREASRFNPGVGRNLGAERARGQLLVFVDADVILAPDALDNAWSVYQEGLKVFGGALELFERDRAPVASRLEHLFFNHESQPGRPFGPRSNLSSALMVVERETFLHSGGFRDIPRMQDTELTERLVREGASLKFVPKVLGFQRQESPLPKVLKKIFINGKNLYFIRYAQRPVWVKSGLIVGLPAVASLKTARIVGRHLRYQDARGRVQTLLLTPLLSLSGATWLAGFYRSLLFGGEISRKRE